MIYKKLFVRVFIIISSVGVFGWITLLTFGLSPQIFLQNIWQEITDQKDDTSKSSYPLTTEAIIRMGISTRSNEWHVSYIETSDGVFYLVDKTDTLSRKQKVTPVCTKEGAIDCYIDKKVRINGRLFPNKHKFILRRKSMDDIPPEQIEEYVSKHSIQAQELEVDRFDILNK